MGMIFLKFLNRSISGGWLILAVLILRRLLKKAPRWMICMLWALVAVRLISPISIESALSLVPSADLVQYEATQTPSGVDRVNSAVNLVSNDALTSAPAADVNPLYMGITAAGIIWAVGLAVLLFYALVSFLLLRRKIREAIRLCDPIWMGDEIQSPFILGILRPRIYLPSSLDEPDREMVIAHERAHLLRHDHWWKPLGFLLLAVYWFHPLCWAAYILLCRDIELACDEKVIRQMEWNKRKAYSRTLVACSVRQRHVLVCPLAFGEVGVKERVKNVLNYKKPKFWMMIAAVAACAAVAICFLTNPKQELAAALDPAESQTADTSGLEQLKAEYPDYFGQSTQKGLEVYVWQLGEDSYSFGLMAGTGQEKTADELMDMALKGGTTAAEMQRILSTYDIEPEEIQVISYRNPLSSYFYETDETYVENVRSMLGLTKSTFKGVANQ